MSVSPDIRILKKLYRKRIRILIQGLSGKKIRQKSFAISQKVLRLPSFRRAQTVMIYLSLPREVQTDVLLTALLKRKKRVAVPLAVKNRRQLELFEVKNPKRDLKPGAYGILEPQASRCRRIRPEEIDCALIPGMAFDRKGRRLGRGAGYFDRFLSRLSKAEKIGIAFQEQIMSQLPHEPHDQKMDHVVTDGR